MLRDRCREGFVEFGVPLDIEQLMRQFVEQHAGDIVFVPRQHRVENGIGEKAQRGIGAHTRDVDVQTGST